MKYIKHKEHGILPVVDFTQFQRAAGWREIDINEEIKPKKKNVTEQMIASDHDEIIEEFLKNKFSPKSKFEEYARLLGCELDRRKTKANMVKEFKQWLQSQT